MLGYEVRDVGEVKQGRNKARGKRQKTAGMRSNPCATGSKSLRVEEGGCFELF